MTQKEINLSVADQLNDMAERVRNGDLVIQSVEYSNDRACVHSNEGLKNFNMTLIGYTLPKKECKTQQEIYKELCDESFFSQPNGDRRDLKRVANRYAIENTQRVWREQYEVH